MASARPKHRCNTCKKVFSTAFKLDRHHLVHSGEKPFSCSICNSSFAQASSLSLHVKGCHIATRPHCCKECRKSFVRAEHLRTHYKTHGIEIQPPKKRKRKVAGVKENTTEKFTCTLCEGGKVFPHAWKLERHLLSHSGQRPFSCPLCGASFTQSSSLKSHVRTHTGEKPYACQECGRAFTRGDHLRHHVRTHTKERPFECELCGKRFASSSSISRHRSDHMKTNLTCLVCSRTFSRIENLRSHMLRVHSISLNQPPCDEVPCPLESTEDWLGQDDPLPLEVLLGGETAEATSSGTKDEAEALDMKSSSRVESAG